MKKTIWPPAVAFALSVHEAFAGHAPAVDLGLTSEAVLWPNGDLDSSSTVVVPNWTSALTFRNGR